MRYTALSLALITYELLNVSAQQYENNEGVLVVEDKNLVKDSSFEEETGEWYHYGENGFEYYYHEGRTGFQSARVNGTGQNISDWHGAMQDIILPDPSAPIMVSGWGQLNTELVNDMKQAQQTWGPDWREGSQLRIMVTIQPCDESIPEQVFFSKLLITEAWDWFRFEPLNIIPKTSLKSLTVACVLRNAPVDAVGFCDDISVTQGEHIDLDESLCKIAPPPMATYGDNILLDDTEIPSDMDVEDLSNRTVSNIWDLVEDANEKDEGTDDTDSSDTASASVDVDESYAPEESETQQTDVGGSFVDYESSQDNTTASATSNTSQPAASGAVDTQSGANSTTTASISLITTTATTADATSTTTAEADAYAGTISPKRPVNLETNTLFVEYEPSTDMSTETTTSEESECTCGGWSPWSEDCQITEASINPDGTACGSGIITRHKACNALCQAPKVISYRKCSVVCHPMAELVVTEEGPIPSNGQSSGMSVGLIVLVVSACLLVVLIGMFGTYLWRSRRRRLRAAMAKDIYKKQSQPLPERPVTGPVMMAGVLVTVEEASEDEDDSNDNYSIDMDEEDDRNSKR